MRQRIRHGGQMQQERTCGQLLPGGRVGEALVKERPYRGPGVRVVMGHQVAENAHHGGDLRVLVGTDLGFVCDVLLHEVLHAAGEHPGDDCVGEAGSCGKEWNVLCMLFVRYRFLLCLSKLH